MSVPAHRMSALLNNESQGKEYGEALYDYTAANIDELNFKAGDKLLILSKVGDWWRCKFRGKEGVVPSNYIKLFDSKSVSTTRQPRPLPVVPQPAQITAMSELAEALYDYNTQQPQDLNFKQGDILTVLKKEGKWWLCKLNNKEGYVPSNFIKSINSSSSQATYIKPAAATDLAKNPKISKTITAEKNTPSQIPNIDSTVIDQYTQKMQQNRNRAIDIFNQAMQAFRNNDFDTAEWYFNHAIDMYPYDPDFYEQRGYNFARKNLPNGAVNDYECALLLDSNRSHLRNEGQRLRNIYYGETANRFKALLDKKIEEYNNIMATTKNKDIINDILGRISYYTNEITDSLLQINDYQGVLSTLELASKYNPLFKDDGRYLYAKGVACLYMNRFSEALDCLNKAKVFYKNNPSSIDKSDRIITLERLALVYKHLGILYVKQNKSELALINFDNAIEAGDQSYLLCRNGKPPEKVGDITYTWLINNRDVQIHMYYEEQKLAKNIYKAQELLVQIISTYNENRIDAVINLCKQANGFYSRLPQIHLFEGLALLKNEKLDQALECLKRCIELDPHNEQFKNLFNAVHNHQLNLEAQISIYKQWLEKVKTDIPDIAIKRAIQGCGPINHELIGYAPISPTGKMDSDKLKELKLVISKVINSQDLVNNYFTEDGYQFFTYKLGKLLQQFFTADIKKKEHVHFILKASVIKKDSQLNNTIIVAINEVKNRYPQSGLPPISQQHLCINNPDICNTITKTLNHLPNIMHSNHYSQSQLATTQNSSMPQKHVSSREEIQRDWHLREQGALSRNKISYHTAAPTAQPVPAPYRSSSVGKSPHSIFFNQENIQTLQEGIMNIAEAYSEGIQQQIDIIQGNYP